MKLYAANEFQKTFLFSKNISGWINKIGQNSFEWTYSERYFLKYTALSHCREPGTAQKADYSLDFVATGF